MTFVNIHSRTGNDNFFNGASQQLFNANGARDVSLSCSCWTDRNSYTFIFINGLKVTTVVWRQLFHDCLHNITIVDCAP